VSITFFKKYESSFYNKYAQTLNLHIFEAREILEREREIEREGEEERERERESNAIKFLPKSRFQFFSFPFHLLVESFIHFIYGFISR